MSAEHDAASIRQLAVVDDNAKFRAIVRELAAPLGWAVHEFENGRGFLKAIERDLRPDLVMLDMVMPDMDGIETTRAFAATSVRCPLVLITGRMPLYTQAANMLALTHGLKILAVLRKPAPIRELRDMLA